MCQWPRRAAQIDRRTVTVQMELNLREVEVVVEAEDSMRTEPYNCSQSLHMGLWANQHQYLVGKALYVSYVHLYYPVICITNIGRSLLATPGNHGHSHTWDVMTAYRVY